MRPFFAFILLSFALPVHSRVLATVSYTKLSKARTFTITTREFQQAYRQTRQMAPNTPPVKKFFDDYLLYRIGVEEAYNDPSLVKNPQIKNMFVNPHLKESFEQMLYKLLADNKLKKRLSRIDTQAKALSRGQMKQYYKTNPEFDINFIVITLPVNPTPAQLKKTTDRATSIHREVQKSTKAFPELIDIYSDDRISGRLQISRTKTTLYPTVYQELKKMKPGQISPPLRTAGGFHIVKLNRVLPFSQANQMQIKAGFFDKKRGEVIRQYFASLKKKYKVQIHQSEFNTL